MDQLQIAVLIVVLLSLNNLIGSLIATIKSSKGDLLTELLPVS